MHQLKDKNADLHGNAPDKSAVALAADRRDQRPGVSRGRGALLRHAAADGPADRRAETARAARRHPGRSTSTTTSAAGGRTSAPRSSTASTTACRARPLVELLRPGRGRLLRPQAEALGVLLHDARHPARVPRTQDADPDRRRRRTSASCSRPTTPTCATSTRRPVRLRRLEHAGGERLRARPDERVLKGDITPSDQLDLAAARQRAVAGRRVIDRCGSSPPALPSLAGVCARH